jgi:hypothetical protein
MIDVPGYIIGECIHEGRRSMVYKDRREMDGLPVIIKVLIIGPQQPLHELPAVESRNRFQSGHPEPWRPDSVYQPGGKEGLL